MFLSAAMLLGGGVLVAQSEEQEASAAVDDGKNFKFPEEKLNTAIAYWMSRGFPFGRAGERIDFRDPNNPSDPQANRVGFIFRGGFFGDAANGELTEFIRNMPGTQEPQLLEYDINIRPTRNRNSRGDERIVRDNVNGLIFYTPNHYTDFHLYQYLEAPNAADVDLPVPVPVCRESGGTTSCPNPEGGPNVTVTEETPIAEELVGQPAEGPRTSGPDSNDAPVNNPEFERSNNDLLGLADEQGDNQMSNWATLITLLWKLALEPSRSSANPEL
jgi:hypothetical protein